MLVDALRAEGAAGATVLDIGGGVGAVHHELLKAGASRATNAEAAPAYLEAARGEAERQGHADRVSYRCGDFVEIAGELQVADIVTLDRVICCYPDADSLLRLSVDKARQLYGVVYPRDDWWTRLGHRLLNLFLKVTRNPFRVFVHATRDVDAPVREAGFEPRYRRVTPFWQVVVYGRPIG